jgi:hypothetical protein
VPRYAGIQAKALAFPTYGNMSACWTIRRAPGRVKREAFRRVDPGRALFIV